MFMDFSTFDGILHIFSTVYRFFYSVAAFFGTTVSQFLNNFGVHSTGFDPFLQTYFSVDLGVDLPNFMDLIFNATLRPFITWFFQITGLDVPLYVALFVGGVVIAFLYNALKNFL